MSWTPTLGALPGPDGTRFRVWAPSARRVRVVGEAGEFDLVSGSQGTFEGHVAAFAPGARYRYLVDGSGPFPDPASRFQPEGVHGPSEVVDPGRFAWTDAAWTGVPSADLILYELHVGTFTPEGTFRGAASKLPLLRDLGVTAVELMPVADFPGRRNWGYDGVALFAPARCYGTPEDLRRFVDEAHRLGLAVLLDVVYNHFGPDGNYTGEFSPHYVSSSHRSLWGDALNFDGPYSEGVRTFVVENALHWLHEYHVDGLRLDATHAIHDSSDIPILAELARRVRETIPGRRVHLIAEDHRNLADMVRDPQLGGWGLDGIWSDDFHHELRRYLRGDARGVFQDFRGTLTDLSTTLRRGWLFQGEYSHYRGKPRGSDPTGLEPRRFVFFLQNHDRVANHGLGERIHELVGWPTVRAATAVLMALPYTPLLFMGQEWAASSPFQFFTDHVEELGRKVREGRVREYQDYLREAGLATAVSIPDPQAVSTFEACRLDWAEREREPHAAHLRLHQALIALRRSEPALVANRPGTVFSEARPEDDTIVVRCDDGPGSALAVVARFKGAGAIDLRQCPLLNGAAWTVVLTTEDAAFVADPEPLGIEPEGGLAITFPRPAAVILRLSPPVAR